MPWCILPLFSQQADSPKKVVITKRSVDADGSEHTETIIKKGKAAENFNADEYVRMNRSEDVTVEIDVENENDHQSNIRINTCVAVKNKKKWSWDNYDVNVREKEACLGVYTSAATLNEKTGAQISDFTEESAAREVQMQKGDLILSVNGQAIQGHEELWNEIAKYNPEDKVKVEYLRDGLALQVEASLKACRDNTTRVELMETDEDGEKQTREFTLWNLGTDEQKQMRERHVITIRRGEGDAQEQAKTPAADLRLTADRKLKLEGFRAFPNPTGGQLTIEFKGEAVATTLALYDASGRQLFREEMNAFSGEYFQQFDLSEYAKGTVVVQVQQGEKLFSEQIVVN